MTGHVGAKSPMSIFEAFVQKNWGKKEEPANDLL